MCCLLHNGNACTTGMCNDPLVCNNSSTAEQLETNSCRIFYKIHEVFLCDPISALSAEEELLAALPATGAAAPLQQQQQQRSTSDSSSTVPGTLLGPAATAPLPPAAAAAAAAAAAESNPGGIFDGLWRLQQEAGQVRQCVTLAT
jgi:hypothetical protein